MMRPLLRVIAVLIGIVYALRHLPDARDANGATPAARPAGAAADASPGAGELRRRWVKQWALRLTVLALLAGFGGVLVMASGVMPITASSGHWAITRWVLQFSKRRSVATHSMTTTVPASLDDRALVLKGAGHYETACRLCHGGPGLASPRVAARMTPRPPDLAETAPTYDPEDLFYIVKHGIKFTGMPAWTASGRDDEVWAMVAFLRALPTLDQAGYQRLVFDVPPPSEDEAPLQDLIVPEAPGRAIADNCSRCHGVDGLGRGASAFPKLAGQRFEYLHQSLLAFARERRHSGMMAPIAGGLDDAELATIARYYAELATAPAASTSGDAALIEQGRLIARDGVPSRDVPPCAKCHGPGGQPRRREYPRLAGQYAGYLQLQLSLFKSGARGGTEYAHVMQKVARQLDEDQMRAAAAYFASLPWGSDAAVSTDE